MFPRIKDRCRSPGQACAAFAGAVGGRTQRGAGWALASAVFAISACAADDRTELLLPTVLDQPPGTRAYLDLPTDIHSPDDAVRLPRLLSETGVFADTRALEVAPGILPYDVQAPLFSDGAQKQRWLALPEGTAIAFAEAEPWSFPEGTVLIKHFEMVMDERRPEHARRLETRLLVAAEAGGYYAATYKWNAAQTEAELVLEQQQEELTIIDAQGNRREQSYAYPAPRECAACHTSSAGYVLGVRTAQLNGDKVYRHGDAPMNQLSAWARLGLLEGLVDDKPLAAYPSLVPLTDRASSVERRLRSYWDGNCSMCHAATSGGSSAWDARYQTPFERQGILFGVPRRPSDDGAFIVTPGSTDYSLLYQRAVSVAPATKMPPLGRSTVDEAYVQLLSEWIAMLPRPRL